MPQVNQVNTKLPGTPNNEWKDLQFRFDGRWIPDVDPSLIGPNNYAKLENLRYKDSGLEGVNGYSKINTTALSDAAYGNYPYIRNGAQLRSLDTQKTYTLAHALNSSDQGRVFVNRTDIGSAGQFDTANRLDTSGNPYYADSATGLNGRFSSSPQGNLAYANGRETMIFGGDESQIAAAFLVQDANLTNPIDVTEELNTSVTGDTAVLNQADYDYMVIMTTRPIQGFKAYAGTSSGAGHALVVTYWNGASWTAVANPTDNTSGGTVTGTYVFDHTDTTVKLKHFEELYLYAYRIELNGTGAALATWYRLTVDTAFQSMKDVWDGVYRQPRQFQLYDKAQTAYKDYTLQVNEPSNVAAPVGGDIAGMVVSDDHIIIMFAEQMAGIRIGMLGSLVNTTANTMTTEYWDGNSWTTLTIGSHNWKDGTSSGSKTFGATGLVEWTPQTDEKPQTLFGSFGYCYRFKIVSANISGTKDDSSVIIDLVTGIPAQNTVKAFDFTAFYKSRQMLCGYTIGNQANRVDFSVTNAPDVYNGTDSSDDGKRSLFFGGSEKITTATQLYNRFGSNILSLLLVLKETETYVLVGSDPDDFTIYPVSKSIGCPAPLTLATGEVNMSKDPTEGTTRNVAMWISSSGPIMFDGAAISSIRGMENFFDPNNDEYIEWSYISRARAWMDNVYKEYNILIPSSSGQEPNNKWLVYDLLRRKWYEKKTGTAPFPQAAWEVVTEKGERLNYAGTDTGFMLYLENGTAWDATGITQRVKTGDFFPSSNIWDETTIRKFKIMTHKFEEVSAANYLDIFYYNNTDELIGSGVTWVDTGDITGVFVSFEDTTDVIWSATSVVSININQDIGAQRIINVITDEARTGWAHAYEFVITTSTVPRGFRPIAWGIQYRVEKKDNKATQ